MPFPPPLELIPSSALTVQSLSPVQYAAAAPAERHLARYDAATFDTGLSTLARLAELYQVYLVRLDGGQLGRVLRDVEPDEIQASGLIENVTGYACYYQENMPAIEGAPATRTLMCVLVTQVPAPVQQVVTLPGWTPAVWPPVDQDAPVQADPDTRAAPAPDLVTSRG